MFSFSVLPPLSLYIHIPWCLKKCPYCDFNSHKAADSIPESAYLQALMVDLECELPKVWGRTIESIFIGGGTPSLFSAAGMNQLLSDIRARLPLSPNLEITLEANPGTFESKKFTDYQSLGINRLSIGVQSFNDEHLQKIGRVHNANEAENAINIARDAGFKNINIDMMYGLPGQTQKQALSDVKKALELKPNHLSYYQLTIEPNTYFHTHRPILPEDDDCNAISDASISLLKQGGFDRYEISAFAKKGFQSKHNLNYWLFGDYIGIGAGAHSKITDANQQSITRSWKIKHPTTYITTANSNEACGQSNTLKRKDVGLEFMMNALRLTNGFETSLFLEHTGLPISLFDKPLKSLESEGFIKRNLLTIQPTDRGIRYLNQALLHFIEN